MRQTGGERIGKTLDAALSQPGFIEERRDPGLRNTRSRFMRPSVQAA